jgi:hypothetical protein
MQGHLRNAFRKGHDAHRRHRCKLSPDVLALYGSLLPELRGITGIHQCMSQGIRTVPSNVGRGLPGGAGGQILPHRPRSSLRRGSSWSLRRLRWVASGPARAGMGQPPTQDSPKRVGPRRLWRRWIWPSRVVRITPEPWPTQAAAMDRARPSQVGNET